jgi:hypothetical protein
VIAGRPAHRTVRATKTSSTVRAAKAFATVRAAKAFATVRAAKAFAPGPRLGYGRRMQRAQAVETTTPESVPAR